MLTLQKGGNLTLSKVDPGLKVLRLGAGWDPNQYDSGSEFDIDISAFVLGTNGKVIDLPGKAPGEDTFLFYNQRSLLNNAIVHSGDNRTGDGDGDDESIVIDLAKLPAQVDRIVFVVTIHDALAKGQNFGQVPNSWVNLYNNEVYQTDPSKKLAFFELSEEFSTETSMVPVELYKHNGEWKFKAVGAGYNGGLAEFCNDFGVQLG
jgi:tellurium resistance protein TerD